MKRRSLSAGRGLLGERFVFSLLGVLGGLACAPVAKAPESEKPSPAPAAAPPETVSFSLETGDYSALEQDFRRRLSRNEPGATVALADLLLLLGRTDEALALVDGKDGSPERARAARALRAAGLPERALSRVPFPEKPEPADLPALVERAELLLDLGRREELEKELTPFFQLATSPAILELPALPRSRALASFGRLAHLLRYPKDANELFNQAEEAGGKDPLLLRYRAELFLEKYDTAHAEEILEDGLSRSPEHPDLLVLLAEVRLAQALDVEEAERLATRALRVQPHHPRAEGVLVGVHLRDFDLPAARARLDEAQKYHPRDLYLRSLKAALLFLSEKSAEFETEVEEVLKQSPGYVRLFSVVREFAEWEHRYEDLERLLRRAVRLDRGDGQLRAELGLNLLRAGSDSEGIVELREAYRLDPFDIRVINTLDLYENHVRPNYDEIRKGPFLYRFPKAERKLLERYVPALAEEAHREMSARYGVTPRAPIQLELYATKDEFAVRTSGLPQIGIAGVCFGRKLAAVSPGGSPVNLGMTLWHEIGHVFHLELSKNRVPRWFTEGLAEWETKHLARGWSREMDRELFEALRAQRLPELGKMNRAFTRAESMQDVGIAYYASERLLSYWMENKGSEKVVALLSELGKKRLPEDVVPEVFGTSFGKLEEEFRAHLKEDLSRFSVQTISTPTRGELPSLEKAANEKGASVGARLRYAEALVTFGKIGDGTAKLEALLGEHPEPEVALAVARVWLRTGQKDDAAQLLRNTFARGADGVELRELAARLALGKSEWELAEIHARRGTELDPKSVAAWTCLAAAARERNEKQVELAAMREVAFLSEHDAPAHERLLTLLLEDAQYDEAKAAAERGIWAGLGQCKMHELAARAFREAGDLSRARFEKETTELVCAPGRSR